MKTLSNTSVKVSVVEITPEDAEILLSKYMHNRPTNKANIRTYVKYMTEGKWELNGEPIIIDDKGLTIDGYHRLSACVQSGHSFQTVFVEGIKHDTWLTLDTGKTRSAGDVFGVEGISNPLQKAAIVSKYLSLHNGQGVCDDSGAFARIRTSGKTRGDLVKMYKKHEEAFDGVSSMASKYAKYIKGIVAASITGGVTAYLHIDKGYKLEELDNFWNKVASSTLPLYTSGRTRLLSVTGLDKQKVLMDMWNKYISSKEGIRVNIASVTIFK